MQTRLSLCIVYHSINTFIYIIHKDQGFLSTQFKKITISSLMYLSIPIIGITFTVRKD